MTKPMLIEALKPGMRANVRVSTAGHDPVVHVDGFIKWELTWKDCDVETLKSVDYEIIPDEPKPWAASFDDCGWLVDRSYGIQEARIPYPTNLRTHQAAEHKAKLDRIFTAILNMPGYGGDFACVHMTTSGIFIADSHPSCSVLKFTFETFADAKAAADYANKLMEASHA